MRLVITQLKLPIQFNFLKNWPTAVRKTRKLKKEPLLPIGVKPQVIEIFQKTKIFIKTNWAIAQPKAFQSMKPAGDTLTAAKHC